MQKIPSIELLGRTPTESSPKELRRRHFGAAMVISILVISLAAMALMQEKARYRERAFSATQSIARLLDQQVSGELEKVDVALQMSAVFHAEWTQAGKLDPVRLNRFLLSQEQLLPGVDSLRIVDREGIVRYGRNVEASTIVSLEDRDYFIKARDDAKAGLIVAGPIFARISKKWVVVLARRLHAADGSFAGVVYANLTCDSFDKVLSPAVVTADDAATIRSADLALIHRYPDTKGAVGSRDVSQQLREMVRNSPSGGEYIAVTKLDGVERTNTYRKLNGYPLYVIVGLSTYMYYEGWRNNALVIAGLGCVTLLITWLATILVFRAHQRLRGDLEERTRIGRDLEQTLVERSRLNAALKVKTYELQESNTKLEQRVSERTAELRKANRELERLARRDVLTGLGNRLSANEHLHEEFLRMKRTGVPYSVLIFDIDHFKYVNDTYGHEQGDLVLRHVAKVLNETCRVTDLVTRFGGEEFLALLPNTVEESAVLVAEKVRERVETSRPPVGDQVTVSVGVAVSNSSDTDESEVVRRADGALYRAKAAGRNCVDAGNAMEDH